MKWPKKGVPFSREPPPLTGAPPSPGTPRMPQDHTFHYHYLLSYPFAFLSVMVLKLTRTTLPGRRISRCLVESWVNFW